MGGEGIGRTRDARQAEGASTGDVNYKLGTVFEGRNKTENGRRRGKETDKQGGGGDNGAEN